MDEKTMDDGCADERTNCELLSEAGVLHPENNFDDDERKAIDELTSQEVNTLISLKEKMGEPADERHEAKPNVFV